MRTLYVTQELRPLRICFVVGRDNKSLLKAIAINTTLWGGIYNPIVQFKKSNKAQIRRNLGLIKEFDPDFIVDFSGGLPEDIKQKVDQQVLNPNDFFFTEEEDKKKGYRIGLRTYGAFIDDLPETGIPDKDKERLSLITTTERGSRVFFAIIFGSLDKNMSPDIADLVDKHLKLPSLKLTFEDYKVIKDSKYIGPIAITTTQLRIMGGGGGFSGSLLYVGDHNNREDLIEYWNLRASGRNVYFLPIIDYKKFEEQTKSFIEGAYIDERFNRLDLDLQIAPSLIKNQKKFEEVANWISNKLGSNLVRRLWIASWGKRSKMVSPDINCITPLYSRDKIPVAFSSEEISSFTASAPRFIDDLFYKDDAWAVNLSFIGFFEDQFVIDLPNQEGMLDIARRDLIFGRWDQVRVSSKGLVYYPDSKNDIISLNPVSVEKVVDTIFDKIGYIRRQSPPGIFAQKILQLMKDVDGCRVFKVKGVREALAKMNRDEGEVIIDGRKVRGQMAKPRPMTGRDIKDIIGCTTDDEFGSKNWIQEMYGDLTLYYGQPKPLNPETILNYLITKKLITVGRKFKCINCSTEEWYKIGTFSATFKCINCLFSQDIPRLDDLNWFYKTEGLVAIADEGRGSLPVILSLWRLNHHGMGEKHFVTSFEIAEKGTTNYDQELDYFFFHLNDYSKSIETVIGEARNYIDYSAKDINKTLKIAKKFKDKPYIAFTTLKDKFSRSEIVLLKSVMKKGYYILPMTRLDLDPYDLYDRFSSLKNKYAVSLEDLSINFCSLNLSLKEGEVYELVEAEKKKKIEKMMAWLDKKRAQLVESEKAKSEKSKSQKKK
ncbi:hypothetical protein M1349_01150 [Patescibacteria group bacterium]|nr:hypothetical protein [Patescibacteria group bacterium]